MSYKYFFLFGLASLTCLVGVQARNQAIVPSNHPISVPKSPLNDKELEEELAKKRKKKQKQKQEYEQALVSKQMGFKTKHKKTTEALREKGKVSLGERHQEATPKSLSKNQRKRAERMQQASMQTAVVPGYYPSYQAKEARPASGNIPVAIVPENAHAQIDIQGSYSSDCGARLGVAVVPTPTPRPAVKASEPIQIAAPTMQRPALVARPLPQAIVIDRRSAVYPYATLTPCSASAKGDYLQLSDGSQWKIRHRHHSVVKRWHLGDAIVIETGKFFTWSAYKLVNYTKGESVDVELIEPNVYGRLSHWVAEINWHEGYLRLQDGSIWRMSAHELLNWNINDEVIVALSKDWFSDQCSYVLVNPRLKNRLIAIFACELSS